MEKARDAELIARTKSSIEKLGSSAQSYGDATLMRFLVVKSMEPEKAAKMFVEWQKWRAEFVPLGFIPDSEVAGMLDERKVYLGGLTRGGHSLLMIKGCKHTPSKDRLQYKKFLVYLMDKSMASVHKGAEIGNEKMVAILDLQQFSYKNVDVRGFIIAFQCMQAYFPDRLESLYIVHMPSFFVSGWRIISRFISKAILQKIKIVRNEEEMKNLVEQIGEEALPECYGGKAKLVALQDVVLESN